MNLEPSRDVGLQNVLRDGLALMRGDVVSAAAQASIVQTLGEILSEADRGSNQVAVNRLTMTGSDQQAIERFSIFFRYLDDEYGSDLPARLTETKEVLKRMGDGRDIDAASRNHAEGFISAFLEAIRRDRSLRPLLAPRTVTYG